MTLDQGAVKDVLDQPPELRVGSVAAVNDQLGVLEHGLDTLSKEYRHSVKGTQDINTVISTFKDLQDAVADMWGGKKAPRPDRSTASSAEKAREVFSVSELLERILLEVHPIEVLNFAGVNRRAYHIVAGSSVLQRHMNLLPDTHPRCFPTHPEFDFTCVMETEPPTCSYSDLFGGSDLFSTQTSSKDSTSDTVVVGAYFTPENLPLRLGRRVRDMFICQPPIREMRAVVTCCNPKKHFDSFMHTTHDAEGMNVPHAIYSETGITVGDLYEATCALVKEHRLCPAAEAYQLDDDGFVKAAPKFQGTIRLQEGDPLLFARRQCEERRQAQMQKQMDGYERLTQYTAAKVHARDAGERIPTLAESEASGTEGDWVDEESS